MKPLLHFGTLGLLFLAAFAVPAARADQPLDEHAPFGVIQFSPGEAWIDLPYALGESWSATLAVLTELKYPVHVDATYVETNGQIRVADLWVAVEPHGSRDASYTRIRIAVDAGQDEYTQVRAEVILDAVATRLAPAPAPAPTPATTSAPATAQPQIEYAPQPLDPAVQDIYTGSYADTAAETAIYNTYNTYNTYDSYGSYGSYGYSNPYYNCYAYNAPYCGYSPYGNACNVHYPYGGWYGGYYASPNYNTWAYASSGYGYGFGFGYGSGYGCNPWWNSGYWGNSCGSYGYPWGGCGSSIVVVFNDDDDDDNNCNNDNGNNDKNESSFGDDVVESSGNSAKGDAATASGALTSRTPNGGQLVQDTPTTPIGSKADTRGVGFPRITVTHRERNDVATRFDPRTTVTRTVDTRTVASASTGRRETGAQREAPTSSRPEIRSTLPRVVATGSSATRSTTPTSGRVVRMSSPSFTPGFAGVTPGVPRPAMVVGGTTVATPVAYFPSRSGSNAPFGGAPVPVATRTTGSIGSAPVTSSPGMVSIPIAPRSSPPTLAPAPRSGVSAYSPPVATHPISAPPSVARPPSISAPAPRPVSVPSFGGSSGRVSTGSFGGGASVGPSAGRSAGASAGTSSSRGGRGRP